MINPVADFYNFILAVMNCLPEALQAFINFSLGLCAVVMLFRIVWEIK